MQPIPTDTGSFFEIRDSSRNLLYVDKTAQLYRLITDPNARRFFLSRPRRFGKSLMISTLKAIFQGRRDLFDGLHIAATDYDWTKYPVLHFNFGFCAAQNLAAFKAAFANLVKEELQAVGCAYDAELPAAVNFGAAIDSLAARGGQCVILIDEYDDPVAKVISDVETAEQIREELAFFFGQLKDRAEKIRFLMVTGVSKFTKMSIFSTLSNLIDLSLDDRYADMLGYTEAELEAYFAEPMVHHAEKMGLSLTDYRAALRRLYNGYRFWRVAGENVYNPVSINMTMAHLPQTFEMYWSETGRPAMLMNILKRSDWLSLDPECVTAVTAREFDVSNLRDPKIVGLLYQTGYLTIRDYKPIAGGIYTLGVPDEEVCQDLALLMTGMAANRDVAWAASTGARLLTGDFEGFFEALKALYAALAYGSKEGAVHEASYVRSLCMLLKGQGLTCQSEVVQANGRSDLVAEQGRSTYIFELKRGQRAEVALSQAEKKQYAAPHLAAGKSVYLIGLAFDPQTHFLADASVEQLTGARL